MKTLDLIVLAPILITGYFGFRKGFIVEFVSTIGFILALVLTILLGSFFLNVTNPWFGGGSPTRSFLLLIVLFFALNWGFGLVAVALRTMIRKTVFGIADHLGGVLLSVLKTMLMMSSLIWLIEQATEQLPKEYTEGTIIYPIIAGIGPSLYKLLSFFLPFLKVWLNTLKELLQQGAAEIPSSV